MALAEMFELLEADSAVDARQALKTFAIDLLVISTDVPDEPFWSLVRRVRRARPSLAWILVGDVSEEALNVARRNGSELDIRVDFQGVNFLDEGDGFMRNRHRLGAQKESTSESWYPPVHDFQSV